MSLACWSRIHILTSRGAFGNFLQVNWALPSKQVTYRACCLVLEFHLTKQQQTNVPSAELVAFFSQVPPHKPTRRKPPCSLPLYSNKTETSQNNGQVSYQFNPRTKNLFSAVCFLMRHELAGSTVIKLCSRRHQSCTIKPSHASTQALTQN